ncbi:HNH endonuclease signature motif containing protein [Spelaeicoccus albus]|uniref:HNH nuclease domain-containing protein n=1 Tax=Spelaeicoccus albus TaxID=1280376 RepID=A0A7Z0A7K0_9MICO|nr:HNH endonuclease signature motif containing protein [Spelaeicoccus albus]NYI65867.1 hypothetical protein [Spelaeicoccus albus]
MKTTSEWSTGSDGRRKVTIRTDEPGDCDVFTAVLKSVPQIIADVAFRSSGDDSSGDDGGLSDDLPALAELAGVRASNLDAGECLRLAGQCARIMAFVEGRQAELLAAFGRARIDPDKVFTSTGQFQVGDSPPDTAAPTDPKPHPAPSPPPNEDDDPAPWSTSGKYRNMAGCGPGKSAATSKVAAPAAEATDNATAAAEGLSAREIFADALERWAGDEVACELDVAVSTGCSRLTESLIMVALLPRCLKAFKSGLLSRRRLHCLTFKCRLLPPDLVQELDATVAGWDSRISFPAFGKRIDRWLMRHEAGQADRLYRQAVEHRHVTFQPDRYGGAWLSAYGPADTLQGLYQRLSQTARSQQNDPPSAEQMDEATAAGGGLADQLRAADELNPGVSGVEVSVAHRGRSIEQRRFDLLAGADVATPAGVTLNPAQVRVGVTVPLMTLMGEPLPGEMAGYGPIPARMARLLAAKAPWIERVLVDPITARPIDAERRKYQISTAAREFIRSRNPECTMPDCSRAASLCQLDHIDPWIDGESGGLSTPDNLQPACVRHHQAKTAKRFAANVVRPEPGKPSGTRPDHESEDHPRRPSAAERRRRWLGHWRTEPRIIRWTMPTGRSYDTIDDHDPDAVNEHVEAIKRYTRD